VRTKEPEAELSLASEVLRALPLAGRLVTGDALYCQRTVCQQILDAGGDYLVIVKANQEKLHDAVALLFAEPPETFARAQQVDQHGDRVEVRRLEASTALAGYLDWPGAVQVCWVERTTWQKGRVMQESRYAITSREREAAELLQRVRGHWAIENRLHWVRDVTLGEDACQVRSGSAPEVLAALRNAVIALLRHAGSTNLAATIRHNAWRSGAALQFLGLQP
jgi:predicted transposase YbfD/YdcC